MASDTTERSEETFQPLAARMLLTDLVQGARDEVVYQWGSDDREDDYPILNQLWLYARAASQATLRKAPDDSAAQELRKRWATADAWYGSTGDRGWRLTSVEASERQEALLDYLYDSGLLELPGAEKAAPRYYLSKKELEGE